MQFKLQLTAVNYEDYVINCKKKLVPNTNVFPTCIS